MKLTDPKATDSMLRSLKRHLKAIEKMIDNYQQARANLLDRIARLELKP
jgi:hypothetical protein